MLPALLFFVDVLSCLLLPARATCFYRAAEALNDFKLDFLIVDQLRDFEILLLKALVLVLGTWEG